jgi:glucokinase
MNLSMNQENPMPLPRRAIGLDVGGTKIVGGIVTPAGEVIERLPPVSTPPGDQSAVVEALRMLTDDLRAKQPDVSAIGVGAAGLIDWPRGHIRWAPNNAYQRLPLRELLEELTDLPTVVDNDANVATWGEMRSGNQSQHMAFLTVGTGVGGGLVLGGELYRGKTGIAAEVGHLIVDPRGGQLCGCGNVGCLEAVASGTALGRYGQEAAAQEPDGTLARLAGGPALVTGHVVHAAARSGDVTAQRLFERVGYWLGVGIASLVNLFDFELIVIGGGLVAADDLLLEPARAAFEQFVFAREHRELPPIVPARLGADAGWIGAGMLALDLAATTHSDDRLPSPVPAQGLVH